MPFLCRPYFGYELRKACGNEIRQVEKRGVLTNIIGVKLINAYESPDCGETQSP